MCPWTSSAYRTTQRHEGCRSTYLGQPQARNQGRRFLGCRAVLRRLHSPQGNSRVQLIDFAGIHRLGMCYSHTQGEAVRHEKVLQGNKNPRAHRAIVSICHVLRNHLRILQGGKSRLCTEIGKAYHWKLLHLYFVFRFAIRSVDRPLETARC